MFRVTCPATTTSMTTALGGTNPSMGMSGIPMTLGLTGLLTAKVTGTGSILGVGPGWVMSLGVSLLITMAVGRSLAALGVGAPDRSLVLHAMAPRLSASSAAAGALDLASALAGSLWAGVSRFSPGSIAAPASST